MSQEKNLSDSDLEKKAMSDSLANFYKQRENKDQEVNSDDNQVTGKIPPKINMESPDNFQSRMQVETDPDLVIGYENVDLPSKGLFYPNGLNKVKIEYLTSRDEDILTTPSLIQDGTVLDVILQRKIKTPNVDVSKLLTGDKNALILFLRASSYGHEYEVQVRDPRNDKQFSQVVDLTKLKSKELTEHPNEQGLFEVKIPMRKKNVKFRLLTSGEEDKLVKRAQEIQEAYGHEYSEYSTMKLKAHIVEIEGRTDRSYIERFVDAMPVLDTLTIRKKILVVSPDIDMSYEFKTKDGHKFKASLTVGVDFFFPSL